MSTPAGGNFVIRGSAPDNNLMRAGLRGGSRERDGTMTNKAAQSDFDDNSTRVRDSAVSKGRDFHSQPDGSPIGGRLPSILQRAQGDLRRVSPVAMLSLQRAIGNQAVGRLIGRPVQFKEAEPAPHRHTRPGGALQPKLMVGAADDPYEHEADRMAAQVMRMPTLPAGVVDRSSLEKQALPKDEVAQTKPLAATIRPLAQRSPSDSSGTFEPDGDFESRLTTNGAGTPLPASTRAFMEPRFGAGFSAVRLHTGREPAKLNRAINAQAFTRGSDILGEGRDDIESGAGKSLLAHELTHTIQQGAAGPPDPPVQRMRVSIQRDGEGTPQAGAFDVPTLDQQYNLAVQAGKWREAAEKLNGFNRVDIMSRLAKLTPDQLTKLHQGAVDNPTVGPQSNVAQLTAPGAPQASTPAPTASVLPSLAETLDQQYQAHLAAPRWDDAARTLNGFSDDDIRKRIERLGWDQLEPMKEASDHGETGMLPREYGGQSWAASIVRPSWSRGGRTQHRSSTASMMLALSAV